METPILTPMQQAIELLRVKSRSMLTHTMQQRKIKGAYVDAICVLTDLLPKEQEDIEQAYDAGSEHGFNGEDKTGKQYFNQTYKETQNKQ